MKFYDNYWPDCYDELITYYPRFYRDVLEMDAILHAHGHLADQMQDGIEKVYLSSFIDYMDEQTVAQMVQFLHIGLNKKRTLEERRRLVKSFFVGLRKVSASMLAEMIQSYTQAAVDSVFEISDDEGNNTLYINFERGDVATLYMSDIMMLLERKIPAHINWRAAVAYHFPVGIGIKRVYYKFEHELTGTKPDIALHGDLNAVAAVAESMRRNALMQYKQSKEDGEYSGVSPEISLHGDMNTTSAVAGSGYQSAVMEYELSREAAHSGRTPAVSAIGNYHSGIDTGAEVKATSFGADYIFCGTTAAHN